MENAKLEALVAAAMGTVRKEMRAEFEAMLEARVAAEVEARLAEAVKQLDSKGATTTLTTHAGTEGTLVDPTGALESTEQNDQNILCFQLLHQPHGDERPRGEERTRGESLAT